MSLFRRKNSQKGKIEKEDILQHQVEDLQAEVKRLSNRLVAMQSRVKSKATVSHRTAKSSTPSSSLRPSAISPSRLALDRKDQTPNNKSFGKNKAMERVFVPKEIDFVSSEFLQNQKEPSRPEPSVSNIFPLTDEPQLPISEMIAAKHKGNGCVANAKIKGKDLTECSSSIHKKVVVDPHKNKIQPSTKLTIDGRISTNGQTPMYTFKDGRKVKRIIRKVRVVRQAPSPIQTTPSSVTITTCNKTISATNPKQLSLSSDEKASAHSRIRISNETNLKNRNISPPKKEENKTNNGADDEVEPTDTFTSPAHESTGFKFQSEPKYGYIAKQNEKHTAKTSNSIPQVQGAKNNGAKHLVTKGSNFKKDLLSDIRSGLKLNKVERASEKLSSPSENILASMQSGMKRCHATEKVTPDKTPGFVSNTGGDVQTCKSVHSIQATINPARGLLADIRAGKDLKKVEKDTESTVASKQVECDVTTPLNFSGGLLADIRTGVKLRKAETSAPKAQNQSNSLLDDIKAGVKLKQIDRSLFQASKKRETPMSALLAKIQQRKEECLRQEAELALATEESEIDW